VVKERDKEPLKIMNRYSKFLLEMAYASSIFYWPKQMTCSFLHDNIDAYDSSSGKITLEKGSKYFEE
jgi:hypothetical protein